MFGTEEGTIFLASYKGKNAQHKAFDLARKLSKDGNIYSVDVAENIWSVNRGYYYGSAYNFINGGSPGSMPTSDFLKVAVKTYQKDFGS